MGGKSKTQQQSQTSSTAPPDWVTDAYKSLFSSAQDAAGKGYQAYTGNRVAGLSPEQEAGIQATTAAVGKADPYYGKAAGYLDQSAQTISPMAYSGEALQQFMNPYQKDVIDATLAQTAENDRRQQQDLTGKAIMSGAWGGDRAGVAKAELGRQQKMAADSTLAGLNSQNFSQALQAFQQQQGVDLGARQSDASRQASAGSQFMNLGQSAQDSALKDAYAQIQAGGVRQQNEQAKADAAYEEWLNEQAYPYQSQGWLANILGGIGSGAGSTSTGTTTSKEKGGGGGAAGAVTAGIGLATKLFGLSDERLKEDIEQVGETFDGQPIYRYRFKGSPKTEIGLMAQEVEDVHPEAVGNFGGIKMVDYRGATDDAAREGFADGGVPYSGRVKSRIPDTSPMKFRAGLMGSHMAAPSTGSRDKGDSASDYGKLGGALGDFLKGFGSKSPLDISSVGFTPSSVGSVTDAFSGDMGGFGQVYARGGAVPDMEEGPDGVFRVPRASGGGLAAFFDPEPIGGPIPYAPESEPVTYSEQDVTEPAWRSARPGGNVVHTAENDMDTLRLERALGMVQNPQDIEAIIRTVHGEAAGESPEGKRAVAAVIKNRAAESGMTPADVVLAPNQFEPWMTEAGRSRMQNMGPGKFQQTAKELDTVFRNLDDPTGGATHFYAPQAQASLGRQAPKWDDGTGADIGNHRFFAHGYGGGPSGGGMVARSGAGLAPQATAFAPGEESQGSRTTAFDAVKPTGLAPLGRGGDDTGREPTVAKSPDGQKMLISPELSDALIAAGLAMMASRNSNVLGAIGEGGLAGLKFYGERQQARTKLAADERDRARKTVLEDRDYGLRSRSADVADKSLLQRAQEARERLGYEKERLGLSRRQVEEAERKNKVAEEAGSYQFIPGQGADAEGNTVAGTYKVDKKTGAMEFQPGIVTGAKPRDPEADMTRKAEFDRLKGLDEAAEGARGIRQSVANLRELRKGVSYEGMPLAGPASKVAGMVGYGGGQALESAATNFKLDLSSKLKGAISDKEQAMLNSATPGLGMSDDAANQTLATYEGVAERAIERQRFYQTWRARNKSLGGADEAWDRYVNENPVVQADKDGKLALNRQNLGNWQKYVAAPVKAITSKAEYDKLKPGDKYRDPNGDERVKGGDPGRARGGGATDG